MAVAYLSILGFFLLGCANMAIGLFFSSLTDNPVIAAVMSFGFLLICFLMDSISGMVPNTAIASLVSFTVLALLLAAVIYNMIRNVKMTVAAAVVVVAVLAIVYAVRAPLLEGAFPRFLSVFYMNGQLTGFFDGILYITGMVYYVSIAAVALFLSIQTVVKRRWN